ncbi:hypothetical protein CISG_04275 [Coccidioides immitis RMSCC 3703]|uniref:BTB domain-containing protein n=1 Tax=Coccidioides immitis RMSCC 3703 TaxID=454286 RepID=A0A0J8QTK3_COCIT|nr:hypothetical protein CISG_04275 [Coccidioides immitis RMSCC 3703]
MACLKAASSILPSHFLCISASSSPPLPLLSSWKNKGTSGYALPLLIDQKPSVYGPTKENLKRYGYGLNSQFADLTIRVADEEFKVHKVVVCGQSEFFSRMFSSDWKENVNNEVKLGEVDPSAVEAMIHFMYGIDYDSSGSGRGRVSPVFFNTQVYALAEEYEVQKLKQLAKEKFATSVRACWDMDDFPPVIVEVYNTTPSADRGLRDTCWKAATTLRQTSRDS